MKKKRKRKKVDKTPIALIAKIIEIFLHFKNNIQLNLNIKEIKKKRKKERER